MFVYKRLKTPGETVVVKRVRQADLSVEESASVRSPEPQSHRYRPLPTSGIFRRQSSDTNRSGSSSMGSRPHRRSKRG